MSSEDESLSSLEADEAGTLLEAVRLGGALSASEELAEAVELCKNVECECEVGATEGVAADDVVLEVEVELLVGSAKLENAVPVDSFESMAGRVR